MQVSEVKRGMMCGARPPLESAVLLVLRLAGCQVRWWHGVAVLATPRRTGCRYRYLAFLDGDDSPEACRCSAFECFGRDATLRNREESWFYSTDMYEITTTYYYSVQKYIYISIKLLVVLGGAGCFAIVGEMG